MDAVLGQHRHGVAGLHAEPMLQVRRHAPGIVKRLTPGVVGRPPPKGWVRKAVGLRGFVVVGVIRSSFA